MLVERRLISLEVAEMGGAVAKESMQIIANMAFGDNDFGNGRKCLQFHTTNPVVCDDLDDFDNMSTAEKKFELGGIEYSFILNVDVEYRDEANRDSSVAGPTNVQAVTVSVQDKSGLYLPSSITLERQFSTE